MKRLAALFLVCATASMHAPAAPVSPSDPQSGSPPSQLIEQVSDLLQRWSVPGVAIAKVENGRVVWIHTAGERAPGEPMSPDTVFNVASLTKPVFAMLVLQQVAAGTLTLDQPLADAWVDPDIADDPRALTLTARIALSHQTGLPNWRGGAPLRFGFSPGERHEYSGEGFEYLRRALERIRGQSMREMMQTGILAPLSMRTTQFGWDDRFEGHMARGYRGSGDAYAVSDLSDKMPNAAAHMMSTVGDYARFAAWVARGADLPDELFAEMQRPQALHADPSEFFGLGWRLIRVDSRTVLSHDGREPGVRTQVFVVPETSEALVILTSSDNGELLTRPLVEATLSRGTETLAAVDRDTWTYLQRIPSEQIGALTRIIAGSPSFMSRFLHAVNSAIVSRSDLPSDERQQATQAVDTWVADMMHGRIDSSHAQALLMQLQTQSEDAMVWRRDLNTLALRDWVASLGKRMPARATREPVAVDTRRLSALVGDYRMPSSQLLIHIRQGDAGLEISAQGMPVIQLLAESPEKFFMREDDTRFEFLTDEHGAGTALRAIWAGGRSEVAPREPAQGLNR